MSDDDLNDAMDDSERAELDEMDAEARRHPEQDHIEVEVFSRLRDASKSHPVQPIKLTAGDSFQFRCHRGVACWNKCCHGADITLTPGCILRLSKRLAIEPRDLLAKYTVPAYHETTGLPVAKLKMGGAEGDGPCPFNTADGCSVYDDRPATCRYYPLGLVSMKMFEDETVEDFFFLVTEPHCLGHKEDKTQSPSEFRVEQGVDEYDRVNRGWIDILMKMASWKGMEGPWGKGIDTRKKQMFFMATTDVQAFRRFVFETRFLETYEIDAEALEVLKTDDVQLLQLAFDWLKNVFFNEPTIAFKEVVLHEAVAKAREEMGAA